MSQVIGTKEAAEILNVTQRSVIGLLGRGTLAGKQLGREWAVDKDSVLAYKTIKNRREAKRDQK